MQYPNSRRGFTQSGDDDGCSGGLPSVEKISSVIHQSDNCKLDSDYISFTFRKYRSLTSALDEVGGSNQEERDDDKHGSTWKS